MAKEFNNGIEKAMYAATPPLEALKLLTRKLATRDRVRQDAEIAADDNNSSITIHVHVHRGYLNAQARPNTDVEVPDEDQPRRGKVCG